MKKSNIVTMSALALALSSNMAFAAGKSGSSVDSFLDGLDKNFSVTTNYVWRGLTASGGAPAVQGGATWNHSSGLSVDAWFSSSGASVLTNEYDLTISYSGQSGNMGYDVGVISYHYPQTDAIDSFYEIFAGLNVNNLGAYIYLDNENDNTYIELSADLGRIDLTLGVNSNDNAAADYNQITAAVELTNDLSLSVSQTDLDGDDTQWALTYSVPLK